MCNTINNRFEARVRRNGGDWHAQSGEVNFRGITARAVYALATRWSILKLSAMIVVLGEER